jgi:hypothetical protein
MIGQSPTQPNGDNLTVFVDFDRLARIQSFGLSRG